MVKNIVLIVLSVIALGTAVVGVMIVSGSENALVSFVTRERNGIELQLPSAATRARAVIADPDQDNLRCREAKYSTRGVAMEVVKLIGDEKCYPVMQLPETNTNGRCGSAHYEGSVYSIGRAELTDPGDGCGAFALPDVRNRGTVYIDRNQYEEFSAFIASDSSDEQEES